MNGVGVPPRVGARASAGGVRGLAGVTFSTTDLVGLRTRAAGLSPDACLAHRGGRSGARLSRLRGRGMEYSESRIYLPGDDIRSIDWRVTARTGRPHTKLFHEERDRPVLFVVDLGPHMWFGTRRAFKSVVAAETAALLAWAAVEHGDRVGGLALAGHRPVESRLRGGRRGAIGLFRALAEVASAAPATTGAGLDDGLAHAHRVARPGTLVIVVSDFSGLRGRAAHHLAKLRARNDLLCVWIHDRLEAVPPPPARYPIGDGRRTTILDTRSGEVVRAVAERLRGIEVQLAAGSGGTGARLVRIRCGDDVRDALRPVPTGEVRRRPAVDAVPGGSAAPGGGVRGAPVSATPPALARLRLLGALAARIGGFHRPAGRRR